MKRVSAIPKSDSSHRYRSSPSIRKRARSRSSGPKGKVGTLNVQNPAHFKVVKVGDQGEVTCTEAVAPSVEPAPMPAGK